MFPTPIPVVFTGHYMVWINATWQVAWTNRTVWTNLHKQRLESIIQTELGTLSPTNQLQGHNGGTVNLRL